EGEERQQDRAGGEHVVRPHRHGQQPDGQGGEDQACVAEERLTREDGEDLGDHAEEREREDVDLGVPEEPEQVLPQDGAPVAGVIDVPAELTVVEHPHRGGGEQGEGHEDQHRGHEDVPGEDRQSEHRHTRGPQTDDGRQEVDGAEDRADAADCDTEDPQIGADLWRVDLVREGQVHGPAERRRAPGGDEARQEDDATEAEQPEAEGIESGEGDGGGADLQRDDVVAEADHDGGAEEQQHDRSVEREHLVVLLVRQELQARQEQLGADEQGHQSRDEEHDEASDDVHQTDRLVIGRGEQLPRRRTRPAVPGRFAWWGVQLGNYVRGRGRHRTLLARMTYSIEVPTRSLLPGSHPRIRSDSSYPERYLLISLVAKFGANLEALASTVVCAPTEYDVRWSLRSRGVGLTDCHTLSATCSGVIRIPRVWVLFAPGSASAVLAHSGQMPTTRTPWGAHSSSRASVSPAT